MRSPFNVSNSSLIMMYNCFNDLKGIVAMQTAPRHNHIIGYQQVTGLEVLDQVKTLFLEYAESLHIDLGFQDFAAELEALPGKYAPPDGGLYLVSVDGKAAGCAALRKITDDACEMKRLYVRNIYRGMGIGSQLVGMIIEAAIKIGYHYICLDTLPGQKAAQAIYESYGFHDIKPYIFNPVEGARYMGLGL